MSGMSANARRSDDLWQITLVSLGGSEVNVRASPSMTLKNFRELAEESSICCDHDGAISLLLGSQNLVKLGEMVSLRQAGLAHQARVTIVKVAPERQIHLPGERMLQTSLHSASSSRTRV